MVSKTVYLVSGANRGIGFTIVQQLVKRDDVLVFAGARDINSANQLQALANEQPSKLKLVKLISADEENNKIAIQEIEKEVGHIDVVIANAGICEMTGPLEGANKSSFSRQFEVNALGPLVLFQNSLSLLRKSKAPKFAVVSSAAGSVGSLAYTAGYPFGAYMTSKAAVNAIFARAHFEHEEDNIAFVVLHPGMIETDMGKAGLKALGAEPGSVPTDNLDDSVTKIIALIDTATREKTGNKLINAVTGEDMPW